MFIFKHGSSLLGLSYGSSSHFSRLCVHVFDTIWWLNVSDDESLKSFRKWKWLRQSCWRYDICRFHVAHAVIVHDNTRMHRSYVSLFSTNVIDSLHPAHSLNAAINRFRFTPAIRTGLLPLSPTCSLIQSPPSYSIRLHSYQPLRCLNCILK